MVTKLGLPMSLCSYSIIECQDHCFYFFFEFNIQMIYADKNHQTSLHDFNWTCWTYLTALWPAMDMGSKLWISIWSTIIQVFWVSEFIHFRSGRRVIYVNTLTVVSLSHTNRSKPMNILKKKKIILCATKNKWFIFVWIIWYKFFHVMNFNQDEYLTSRTNKKKKR